MAKFVVGQSVRVVRENSGEFPHIIGRETTIVGGLGYYPVESGRSILFGYQVDHHMLGFDEHDPYAYFVCEEDELEPTLPQGDEIRETEELYEPEPVEEFTYQWRHVK